VFVGTGLGVSYATQMVSHSPRNLPHHHVFVSRVLQDRLFDLQCRSVRGPVDHRIATIVQQLLARDHLCDTLSDRMEMGVELDETLMRRTFIIFFWISLFGCSPPWDTVTSGEGGFSVKMPSLFVVERLLPVSTPFGSLDYRLLGSDPTRFKKFWPFWSGHGPYVVAYVDLPPNAYSDEDVQRLFEHERNRLLEEAKRADKERSGRTEIILDQPISFRSHPGREVNILLFGGRTSLIRMYPNVA